jgi:hypothetical protein
MAGRRDPWFARILTDIRVFENANPQALSQPNAKKAVIAHPTANPGGL